VADVPSGVATKRQLRILWIILTQTVRTREIIKLMKFIHPEWLTHKDHEFLDSRDLMTLDDSGRCPERS
jgi:DNA-binding HxlR family transcriptional regulator